MIDDHNECEWVNVLSGTGSPALSRTKSQSRKTVVCVCVCVLLLLEHIMNCLQEYSNETATLNRHQKFQLGLWCDKNVHLLCLQQ